jgi:hypothetical protein
MHTGELDSLKRFKDDVREVKEGFECGLSLKNFNDINEGDQLEVFEIQEIARTLADSRMAAKRGSAHGLPVPTACRSRSAASWRICCVSTSRIAHRRPLTLVTLSAVEVTADYAHAKVFYTSLADPSANEMIAEGLKHSASFLRRELVAGSDPSYSGTAFRLRPLGTGGCPPVQADRRSRRVGSAIATSESQR